MNQILSPPRPKHPARIPIAERSFASVMGDDMRALCAAMELPEACRRAAIPLVAGVCGNWGGRPFGDSPPSASDFTDDGSPFEYSVVFGDDFREVRLLAEPQAEPTSPHSNWTEGWATLRSLAHLGLADLERAEAVADLFHPDAQGTKFGLWLSACLRAGTPPLFKIYFDPAEANGAGGWRTINEATRRLGAERCWESRLRPHLERSNAAVMYFSLDLAAGKDARTKIYAAAPVRDAAEFEQFVMPMTGGPVGYVTQFCDQLTGQGARFNRRKPIVCWELAADDEYPAEATIHLPVRCYVDDDAAAVQRVKTLLRPADAAMLDQAVHAVKRRDLSSGPGFVAYVSTKLRSRRRHLTVYLSVEAYAKSKGAVPPDDTILPI